MDFLQCQKYGNKTRTFRSWIRVTENPELLVQIRWYTAPPGAAVFPGVHAYGRLMWDRFEGAEPPTGLGVTSFSEADTCPDFPPPGITGIGCNTPLDWFLNGVPPGTVGPWPYPPCATEGEPWIIRAWASPGGAMGTSVIPLAGLTVAEYSIRSCLNAWQVLLWTNPTYTPGPNSQFTDLVEAVFQGYSRQSPVFSTTQQQADGSSVAVSAPLAWVFGGGAPVSVYGWAIVAGPTQQLITLAKLTAAPTVLANPGDRVFIPSFWFVLSPFQPTQATWTGAVGLGIGNKGFPPNRYWVVASGWTPNGVVNCSPLNGTFPLYDAGGGLWNGAQILIGGVPVYYVLSEYFNVPLGEQVTDLTLKNAGPPFTNIVVWRIPGTLGLNSAVFPLAFAGTFNCNAPSTVYVYPDASEDTTMLIGSVVWDTGSDPVPPLHVVGDGSAISRTTYSALFARFGTTYGIGDGSTTFNVPDLRDRVAIGTSPGSLSGNRPSVIALGQTGGEETHTLVTGETPSHTHTVTDPGHTHGPPAGSSFLYASGATPNTSAGASNALALVGATGSATTGISLGNTGGGGSHNNYQPYIGLRPLIYAGV